MPKSFLPVSGLVLPRFAGLATFMRLPYLPLDTEDMSDVHIGLVGVPWDGGTTNRPGARHGPRQLRDLSTMIRRINPASGIDPFVRCNCADLGDVGINPVDVNDTMARVSEYYDKLVALEITPMTAGGDHLLSLPVLRALAKRGPLGMIYFDSHTDLFAGYFGGFRYTHGTPFRRAVEEGLLEPKAVVQIGVRGTMYDGEDIDFARANGIRIVRIEELMDRGVDAVMKEARAIVGDRRVYVSFDIDAIDPSQAPGTGTPEIGGFSTFEAQRMVRLLENLDIVGADLVEVAPPLDPSGNTAWVGVSIMFELLCAMTPAVQRRRQLATPVRDP